MPLNQCFGPNRLLPGDVIGDDSPEHMKFALLHVVPPSPAQPGALALARPKCQSNRMSGLVPGAEPAPWRELAAAVATHWHYDHSFGLAGFADLQRLAHESVRERLLAPEARRIAAELGVNVGDLALPSREIVV